MVVVVGTVVGVLGAVVEGLWGAIPSMGVGESWPVTPQLATAPATHEQASA